MAHRSQCSSAGDNPLDPNYLPPHYREEYRLAIDALVEDNLDGYYDFLQQADVVDFLSTQEINYIQCIVRPPKESKHPDQRFLESGADGSSDTYWPIHSDLDAPGLDLGWPQLHRFIGPTEVTTLVNPAEPDMPTIKEQARRLIKNAQEVIAIVMDMFTDVDIFADILNAAMRNVAVYILLDEHNAHHFVSMASNCRVNLESIQFLRVRTVSGITYHCRSGNSFKGQMMDRFLLTDCRAVLSGNYSFMWSFEKIHRCLAHLFLGQLVSTFDEEFRILFAQSQPLIIENVLDQMEDFSHLTERQYPCDRTPLYNAPRKFSSTSRPEEWARHSFDERMDKDWKNTNRHEPMHRSLDQGPADMYNKFPSQQLSMDPSYEQGHSRMPLNIMDSPAFKRHSYAEGGHGRHSSYQFLQHQGVPNVETHGRQFHRGQHPYPRTGPGLEVDYSGYSKFRDQGYHQVDQYSEPGLPQELEPPDNFDPVLNYLSSTSNVDFDQLSDKLLPAAEGPAHPRRLSLGPTYACKTSPTTPNPPDQKQFFQEPNTDRKDPTVKQGLRNWRINSYLTAFDNTGDEDLPLATPQGTDTYEEPSYALQQTASGTDLSVPKFATREFKIPAPPRASQLPSYTKPSVPESSRKMSDDSVNMVAENKTTPTTPSESSSTTEGNRIAAVEPKEPKGTVQREESFRRKYNAAVQRSSRLRSSLIFSSQLDQHVSQDSQSVPAKHDEGTDKNEDNLPIASQILSQRRSIAREPFEWSRYVKSATFDNSTTETSKADDVDNKVGVKDSSKEKMLSDLPENNDIKESCKPTEIESAKLSPSVPRPKINQPVGTSLLSNPSYIDMNDPDNRLMFFKELAAQRKAAQAAAAEKSTERAIKKPPSELKNTTLKMEEPVTEEVSQNPADSSFKKPTALCETLSEKKVTAQDVGNTKSTEACGSGGLHLDIKEGSHPKGHSDTSPSWEEERTRVSTDSEKTEPKISQESVSMSVSAGSDLSPTQPPEEPKRSNPSVKECSPSHPLTVPDANSTVPSPKDSLAQSTDKNESPLDSIVTVSNSLNPSLVELPPSSKPVTLESSQDLGLSQLESSSSSLPAPPESSTVPHPIGSEVISSHPSAPSPSSDHTRSDGSSQDIPFNSIPSPSTSTPHSSSLEFISSNISPEDSSSTPASNILSPNSDKRQPNKSLSPSPSESQSTNQTSQESTLSSITQTVLSPDSTQVKPDSITQSTSSTSSTGLPESESNSGPKSDSAEPRVPSSVALSSPKDVKVKCTVYPCHSSPVSLLADSCLPIVSGLESSTSLPRPDQKDPPKLTPAEPPTETGAGLNPAIRSDFPTNASPSKPDASHQVVLTQATSSPELTPTGSSVPGPTTIVSCSAPLSDSGGSTVSPKTEKTETNTSPTFSPPETSSSFVLTPTTSSKCPISPSTETLKVIPVPTEPKLPCKTPAESKSVASESNPSEPSVPAENKTMDNHGEVSEEREKPDSAGRETNWDAEATNKDNKTTQQESVCHGKPSDQAREKSSSEPAEIRERETSDEVVPQSKQPKASHSRYHSSTANVISSSNLRDDTKLLLGQISANSQSRAEPSKESAVTDDDKEDKAEKEAGTRSQKKGQPKNTEEREKLLEKLQSMRKERKVYSRFEMGP